ncbi:NYN domain-containing protein, partial [Achromobacter xylosoxidans]
MNAANENVSMALFCDFENVALGVRDTKYQKFDIRPVLERLLLKGSIVVKKAYCDWERYKEFKAPMHEANFELIEIPHVRQSGKNSADIRLVVDALDFCYTKSHVNTFVIISGDSDFSPLVSKLRENDKKVIGVGVKQSTSDLLIANCDEFIFYDDLAREGQRAADARRDNRGGGNAGQRRSPDEERRRKEELEARKTQAVDMVVETFEALMAERGDSGKIWASALKDALKRRRPDFNESYYGFRAFGNLLDEAQSRGFLEVGREEKSGTYVYRDSAGGAAARAGGRPAARAQAVEAHDAADAQPAGSMADTTEARPARGTRGGRKNAGANSLAGIVGLRLIHGRAALAIRPRALLAAAP